MGTRIESITGETFEAQALRGQVVVEFGAAWCMPCRMIEPVIEQLAESYSGRVRVFKVDTDNDASLARQYEVRNVPTIVILSDGEVARRFVGLTTFERLAGAIEELLPADENVAGT